MLAKTVGCWNGEGWPIQEVELCLRGLDNQEIVAAEREMGTEVNISPFFYISNHFIVKDIKANIDMFSNHGSVLPQTPESLLADGKFNRVPVMVGLNSGEGIYFGYEYIIDPDILLAFNDPTVWDSVGAGKLFERNPKLNGSDFGECDIQFARAAKYFYVGEQFSQDSLKPVI